MSVVSSTWLSLSGEANYIRSTYIDGFLDVSSSRGVLLRSDVSFGSRLIMSTSNFTGTVSPTTTAATSSTWVNNGVTWTSSASSATQNSSYHVFDTLLTMTSRWVTDGYAASSGGVYNSTRATSTTIQNVSTAGVASGSSSANAGEWLQIQSSIPTVMQNFTLITWSSNTVHFTELPGTFFIVGSTDNSTWYPIVYCNYTTNPLSSTNTSGGLITIPSSSGTATQNSNVSVTSYSTSKNAYTYFRIVVKNKTTSTGTTGQTLEGFITIGEWNINFTSTGSTSAITLAPSTTTYGQLNLTGALATTSNISSFSTQTSSYASPYTALKFTNTNNGAAGASVAMDFSTYDTLSNTPAARISFLDANYSADTIFSSKVPGAITNAMAERMRITGGGSVGIGVTNPAYPLHVNGVITSNNGFTGKSGTGGGFSNTFNIDWVGGSARVWIDNSLIGTIATASDYRLKENIQPVLGVLDRLCDIPIFSYEFKSQGIFKKNGAHIGYFAHELQNKFPEFNNIVTGTKDECDSSGNMIIQTINNFEFSSVLAKSIQEQQVLIQSQQSQIDTLVARLAAAGIA